MYYPYYYQPKDRQNQQLIRNIEQAINGEYSAIQCYKVLIDQADSKADKEHIREIRKDERNHFHQFTQIYMNLTGRQPTPKQIEECPKTYRRGLEVAFKDEQKTADFYLDIADQATEPYIQSTFRRAAADEQNHAVWFLYFLTRNR
ncbi:ferritin-like domain-containing protein [Pontibacillus sp. HMF3514]|uniref:ferritin-like domain-containing protein n=1 Tax=Pontibacillus sp. HMF3514 TaxID=2692425 RepID=UPI00131FD0C2|nr:ferritin-like domain-containing protein [Pontibacillus sp. HMF3514]QHE52382.1 ferritin-like domain-containing protein [Pontibacillus sp. HMF3514]